ncbi:tail fiber protein [Vibrio phage JSF12]|uniref:Tail fiber protein n=1 Tax=Vibrio phage JSF12 TaxID=1983595 RepID=A0A2D0YMH2_9CAUD|nr:tail fiber protein [Vibrio phage JSF12]ASV43639.1 tail fiber protein [Vibrio phage JSF12]
MTDLIIREPVLDGQQLGPVTIQVEGSPNSATIEDSLLNGSGSEILVTVDEGLQVVGLESLVELQAQLGAIEGRVNAALLTIEGAVESANDIVDQLNQASADLLALVVRAETAANNAGASEVAAEAAKVAAKASELAAASSQAAAAASATNSANSATAANNSKNAAASSAAAALASQNAAKISETNSKTSETNAANSASAANSSKNAAATSATNASNSAADALASKDAAATSATSAANSATAANNSKDAAASSASAAATSASEANTSKNAAASSATNAANSATAANNSKNAAATSEANSAANAASATAAKNLAQKYATAPENEVVESGRFSAFHWAEKAKQFAQQTFVSAGTYNPTTANPYPSVVGVTRDTMWLVKLTDVSGRFTYTTGALAGTTVTNGDFLFYDTPSNTWEHIPVGIAGVLEVNGKSGQSVTITAQDVGALPITGGTVSGSIGSKGLAAHETGTIGLGIGRSASFGWIAPILSNGSYDYANQLAFNPTTGYWTSQGHKIYTAGQKPKFEDLLDSVFWLAPNAGRIRVGGNTDLVAGRDDKGFLPRKEGVGAAAVSYLGTADWWFGESWVNIYKGGAVDVSQYIKAPRLIVKDWGFRQHSNGNLELRHGTTDDSSLYIQDDNKDAYFFGALYEQGNTRVYSPNNKPAVADVTGLQASLDSKYSATNKPTLDVLTGKAADAAKLNGRSDYYHPGNKPTAADVGALTEALGDARYTKKVDSFSGNYNDLSNKPAIPATASDVGAVSKSGDTMTGALRVNKGTATVPGLFVGSSTYKAVIGTSSTVNEVLFGVSANAETLSSYLRIGGTLDSLKFSPDAVTQYVVYHAGNKPTATDIGALPSNGKAADADKLDGYNSSLSADANTVAVRDGSGDIAVRLIRSEYPTQSEIGSADAGIAFRIASGSSGSSDNYTRFVNKSGLVNWLGRVNDSTLFLGKTLDTVKSETRAGLVVDTVTVNGKRLNANVTITAADVGLGNVPNYAATNSYSGTSTSLLATQKAAYDAAAAPLLEAERKRKITYGTAAPSAATGADGDVFFVI